MTKQSGTAGRMTEEETDAFIEATDETGGRRGLMLLTF